MDGSTDVRAGSIAMAKSRWMPSRTGVQSQGRDKTGMELSVYMAVAWRPHGSGWTRWRRSGAEFRGVGPFDRLRTCVRARLIRGREISVCWPCVETPRAWRCRSNIARMERQIERVKEVTCGRTKRWRSDR